jgi:hypothetical protein
LLLLVCQGLLHEHHLDALLHGVLLCLLHSVTLKQQELLTYLSPKKNYGLLFFRVKYNPFKAFSKLYCNFVQS